MTDMRGDRGSSTLWVLAFAALVLLLTAVVILRGQAVLARHRAESAADLAALAAAGQIGISTDICAAAATVATANAADLRECLPEVAADGRTGSVRVRVSVSTRLPVIGARSVTASARAGRGVIPIP